ncbi:MAG: hypothetical protein SX243_17705 [Acidobacteriota bacterium]|nr:hypothetical protein [Acidobacteriota bacterium]
MPLPVLGAVLKSAASMVEKGLASSFSSTIETVRSVASGQTPSLEELSDLQQELSQPSAKTEEAHRPAPQSDSPKAPAADDTYRSDEHGQYHFFPTVEIIGRPDTAAEDVPNGPTSRADQTQREPAEPAGEEAAPSRAREVPGDQAPSSESPAQQAPDERFRAHRTTPAPVAPDELRTAPEHRQTYESPFAEDVFRTPREQAEIQTRNAEIELNREMAKELLRNPDWSNLWEMLHELERANAQRVLDGQGRNITAGQHEKNRQRALFQLQMDTGRLIAGSPMAGAGAMYAMLLTNDPVKIHAMAQLFNFAPTPGMRAKTGRAPVQQYARLPSRTRSPRRKPTSLRTSARGKTRAANSPSATQGRRSKTRLNKKGQRIYKGRAQPGMRGKIKLPRFSPEEPDFNRASFFDTRLPHSKRGAAATDAAQFGAATREMKALWKADPTFKHRFTLAEQKRILEAFGDMSRTGVKDYRIEGFTWHHSTDAFGTGRGAEGGGVIQLLNRDLHKFNSHHGGRFITGGKR